MAGQRARKTLTAAAVEKLKAPASGQVDHFDSAFPGLAVRISYGGRKAWTFFYRLQGKQHRFTLGTFPAMSLAEARDAWREAHKLVEQGIDPAGVRAEAKAKVPDTVRTVGAAFVEKWCRPRNRTAGEVERMLERHVYSEIGDRDIRTVTRRDVFDVLDAAEKRGVSVRANRILAAMRRMFNWAVERGILDASPVVGIKPPAPETARDRVLTDDELRAFLRVTATTKTFGPIFRMLLLTGQRRDEVGEAPWAEFDLAERVWHRPGTRTKNGRAHSIPLSDQVVALLSDLSSKGKRDLLFPALFSRKPVDGTKAARPRAVSGYTRAKERLDAAMLADLRKMAVERGGDPEKVILPPWRLHDLRRTAATGMARLGIAVHIVEAAMNHKSGTISGIAAIYNRFDYGDEKRSALQAWANFLDSLTAGPSNVVPLARAR